MFFSNINPDFSSFGHRTIKKGEKRLEKQINFTKIVQL